MTATPSESFATSELEEKMIAEHRAAGDLR
jgi:hypothetical protein